MHLVTQENLCKRVRKQLDLHTGGGEPYQDEESLVDYLDQHLQELYDLLINAYGHEYAWTTYGFPTVAGTVTYDLPKSFYKVVRVEVDFDGTRVPLEPFSWSNIVYETESRTWTRGMRIRYRVGGLGSNDDDHPRSAPTVINFFPVPANVINVFVQYIPVYPGLSKTRRFDDVNGWSWFAVYGACADIAAKLEQDPAYYLAKQDAYRVRLAKVAGKRDEGGIERVADLKALRRRRIFGRLF